MLCYTTFDERRQVFVTAVHWFLLIELTVMIGVHKEGGVHTLILFLFYKTSTIFFGKSILENFEPLRFFPFVWKNQMVIKIKNIKINLKLGPTGHEISTNAMV